MFLMLFYITQLPQDSSVMNIARASKWV